MLDNGSEFALRNLKNFVEAHPLKPHDMQKIQAMGCAIGDDTRFTALLIQPDPLFQCCHVIYSVEDHPQKMGKPVRYRHVSIEEKGTNRPDDKLVNEVIKRLGFHCEVNTHGRHIGIAGSFKIDCVDGAMSIVEIFDFGT